MKVNCKIKDKEIKNISGGTAGRLHKKKEIEPPFQKKKTLHKEIKHQR